MAKWSSGLCDCFENTNTCCYGFWCCPCLACTVSGQFGENRCLPLCDICSPAILAAFGVPLFVPPAVLSLRAAMRNKYGIKGSLCKDIAVSCFCEWCSWCQMHRELKYRKKNPMVLNVQCQNFTQVQNQNVMVQPNVRAVQQPNVVHMQHPNAMQMQPAPVMMAPGYPPQAGFIM